MYAIGVDLGGTNLRAAVVSAEGQILSLRERATPKAAPEKLVAQMAEDIRSLLKSFPDVRGIGIGFPGPLNRKEGLIRETPNLKGFHDFPLREELQKQISLPIYIDNDAKCAVRAEHCFGAGKGKSHVIMLTLGTGIGGGIVVDGKMLYGKSDGACEIGHLNLIPNGDLCGCGAKGCFEKYVSASAIEARAKKVLGASITNPILFERARGQDSKAFSFLQDVAEDLARGLGTLVNLFDPEMIILGGGLMSDGGEPLLGLVKASLPGKCFESLSRNLEIVASQTGSQSGVLGAAQLVFEI